MRKLETIAALALDTGWKLVDTSYRAIDTLMLQARGTSDIQLTTDPDPSAPPYFTLKGNTAMSLDMGGAMVTALTSEELVSGGNFDSAADFALWTCDLADWTHDAVAGDVDKDQDGVTTLSQAITVEAGALYEITYKLTACTVGSVTASIGGTSGQARSTADTFTEVLEAVNTTTITFTPTNTSRFTIDNISVKKLTRPKLFARVASGTATLEIMVTQ